MPRAAFKLGTDGTLHVEELFPREKAKADKWKRTPYKYWIPFAYVLLCAFAGYGFGAFIDDTVTSYQQDKAEQRPPPGWKMQKVLGIRA